MKKFLFVLPLLLAINCSAQTETKEDFVNEVYQSFVDKRSFYYLHEQAKRIKLDRSRIKEIRIEFKPLLPGEIINELIKNGLQSDSGARWDFIELVNARAYNKDSSELINNISGFFDGSGMDSNQIKEAGLKIARRRQQIGGLYSFSQPVFDHTHRYALMSMRYYCGLLCANGCLYLFKKIKGKWEQIGRCNCSVS